MTPTLVVSARVARAAVRVTKIGRAQLGLPLLAPPLPNAAIWQATQAAARPLTLAIPRQGSLRPGAATPSIEPSRRPQSVLVASPLPVGGPPGPVLTRPPKSKVGLLAVPRRIQLRAPPLTPIAGALAALSHPDPALLRRPVGRLTIVGQKRQTVEVPHMARPARVHDA